MTEQADRSNRPVATRPSGKGYIDESDDVGSSRSDRSTGSGSSGVLVAEDTEDQAPVWSEDTPGGLSPVHGSDDGDRQELDEYMLADEWDIEDEDWDLAHGDFTKQYNRLRQHHAAITKVGGTASSRSGAGVAIVRPPVPARNVPQYAKPNHTTNDLAAVPPVALPAGIATGQKVSAGRRDKDKSDRATQDQVLDSRTRVVLSGLVNRGVVSGIEYCISTGKEANVYYASPTSTCAIPGPKAVKIYRTSILAFRSRQAYILGEQRFRGQYTSSKNPRKMVRVWAEKELRNLRRLEQGGVRSPRAVDCTDNTLVMEFLGDSERPAPRLKDAKISHDQIEGLYLELIVVMRKMFIQCRLVHADLSEYNILYHNDHLYIIDVSQSVEHDHPRSFDFLRADIKNMTDYFSRLSNGSFRLLSLRRAWDYITRDPSTHGLNMTEQTEDYLLGTVLDWISNDDSANSTDLSAGNDDAVFMSSYIPKSLADIGDPERHMRDQREGSAAFDLGSRQEIPHDVSLANGMERKVRLGQEDFDGQNSLADEESDEGDPNDQDDQVTGRTAGHHAAEEQPGKRVKGFKFEDKETKKERKKAFKEEKRENRRHKLPKSDKQKVKKVPRLA